jgi:hypothetical protein
MLSALKRAAIAWLSAATAPIPTWSGASLGTFSELAAEVGFTLSINPTANGRRLGLGPGAGAAASTGRFGGSIRRGVFTFEYTTSLEHLIFNEFNNANVVIDPKVFSSLKHPGPYMFQQKGLAAFIESVKTVELPRPEVSVRSTKRVT